MLPNRGRNLTNYLTRARDHLNREHNAAGHCRNCWRKHTASSRSTCRGPRDPQVEYLSQEVLQKVKSERLSHTLGREDTWWKLHSWVVPAGDSCRSRYDPCKCSKFFCSEPVPMAHYSLLCCLKKRVQHVMIVHGV
jgi:hypothetical protein